MTGQGVQKGARGGPGEASEMTEIFRFLKIAAKYVEKLTGSNLQTKYRR